MPGGLDRHIVEYRFQFGKDEEDQLLELVEQRGAFPDVPFPRVIESPEVGRIAFGDDNTQGVAEAEYIRYHPGIFIIRLQGRVVVYFFESLCVQGVDLDDGDRLVHKIMGKRLRILNISICGGNLQSFVTQYCPCVFAEGPGEPWEILVYLASLSCLYQPNFFQVFSKAFLFPQRQWD
jgi:hypothetical protein